MFPVDVCKSSKLSQHEPKSELTSCLGSGSSLGSSSGSGSCSGLQLAWLSRPTRVDGSIGLVAPEAAASLDLRALIELSPRNSIGRLRVCAISSVASLEQLAVWPAKRLNGQSGADLGMRASVAQQAGPITPDSNQRPSRALDWAELARFEPSRARDLDRGESARNGSALGQLAPTRPEAEVSLANLPCDVFSEWLR